jgi:RNA polymerase sigma-70 factor (ECF subfamily)
MDDTAAIRRCVDGDTEAFRHLVERYQSRAIAHAAAILRDRDDGLDAVQEAFVDAFRFLDKFDITRPFYPWFYVLLRNRCYKMAARNRPADSLDEMDLLAPQSGLTDDDRLSLEKALRLLPAEFREIVTLKYLSELSYDELAEHLQIPKGTVMSRLFHARRQLQKKLSGRFN